MDRVQRSFPAFEKANENYQRASARYRNLSERLKGWMVAGGVSTYIRPNFKEERNRNIRSLKGAYQNMLNTYQKRANAGARFRYDVSVSNLKIPNKNRMTAYQIMNILQRRFAPPNKPGGFGGVEYETAALRWRKKPNRVKSVSPVRRRRTPVRRPRSANT